MRVYPHVRLLCNLGRGQERPSPTPVFALAMGRRANWAGKRQFSLEVKRAARVLGLCVCLEVRDNLPRLQRELRWSSAVSLGESDASPGFWREVPRRDLSNSVPHPPKFSAACSPVPEFMPGVGGMSRACPGGCGWGCCCMATPCPGSPEFICVFFFLPLCRHMHLFFKST